MIFLDKTRRLAYAYYNAPSDSVYLCRRINAHNIIPILEHEFLHQALFNSIGYEACRDWDNIDEP